MRADRDKAISWVLDFIDMDLESMSDSDLMKAGIDLHDNLFPDHAIPLHSRGDGPERLKDVQTRLSDFFHRCLLPALVGRKKRTDSIPLPVRPEKWDRWFWVDKQDGKLHFAEAGEGSSWADDALESLLHLLRYGDSLPTASFQRCEECQRWFFQHRKKRFCSIHCNWRFNSRMQRGEAGSIKREKYNKKQRKVMRARYQREVRKKHPKARVKRRAPL